MDVWIDQKEASGPNDLLSTDDQSAILAAEQGRLGRLVERIDAYEAGLHAVKSGDPNNEASFMGRLELLRKILSEVSPLPLCSTCAHCAVACASPVRTNATPARSPAVHPPRTASQRSSAAQ